MPAMSPTMDKGGVTEWKFKEGESFSSGDVLLEVETDKAQIDVEAQDDGILAKILVQNGGKDIPVGQPIAILAEEGDDLANLEIPDVSAPAAAAAAAPKTETPKAETPKAETPKPSTPAPSGTSTVANPKQVLFPSVATLLAENNISRDDAIAKIKATGPNGRLLKGDVLAYLGKIPKDAAESVASFVNVHSKLDLSNIEKHVVAQKVESAATPVENAKESKEDGKPQKKPKAKVEPIVKTFPLEHVLAFQKRAVEQGSPSLSLKEYINGASSRAERYAYQRHSKPSDYYDPIFEDLVSPSPTVERFTVKLDIPNVANAKSKPATSQLDFAEDLFATPSKSSPSTFGDLTVTLTLKNVSDAKDKAQLYLDQLEKYLRV